MALKRGRCPHCGWTGEISPEEKPPFRCRTCGEALIIEEVPQPTSVAPPPPPYHPYPQYYPPYSAPPPTPPRDNSKLVSSFLIAAGVLGIVFWISFFLIDTILACPTCGEGQSATAFTFSLVMLASSVVAIIGGIQANKRNYTGALLGSVFGLISFGFFLGSVLSLVSLIIVCTDKFSFRGTPPPNM